MVGFRTLSCAALCLAAAGSAFGAVDAVLESGFLKLFIAGGGNCVVTAAGGNVQVNGADPSFSGLPTPLSANTVSLLSVTGDANPNTIDVSTVTVANGFSSLGSISISAEDGNDILIGSADILTGFNTGPGDDTVTGGAGADGYEWRDDDGNDVVDLGSGGQDSVAWYSDVVNEANALSLSAIGSVLKMESTAPAATHFQVTGADFVVINLGSGDDTLAIGPVASALTIHNLVVTPGPGTDSIDASTSDMRAAYQAVYGEGSDTIIGGSQIDSVNISSDPSLAMHIDYTASGAAVIQTESVNSTTVRSCTGIESFTQTCGDLGSASTVADLAGTAAQLVVFSLGAGFDSVDASATAVKIAALRFPGSLLDSLQAGSHTDDELSVTQGDSSVASTCQFAASGAQLLITGTEPTGAWQMTVDGFEESYVDAVSGASNALTFGNLTTTDLILAYVTFGSADDTCTLLASPTVRYQIAGAGHAAGDVLNIDLDGRTYSANSGSATVTGCQPIDWNTVEQVNFLNPPSEADSWRMY